MTTYDVEAADTGVLAALARRGHRIHPSPTVMATIQDKLLQRNYFRERGFPVPSFVASDRPVAADARRIGFTFVQRARRGGYDGRGVVVMRDDRDSRKLMNVPSVFEVPGARLHMYGKSRLRPGRKIGHITVLDDDVDLALERARLARRLLALRPRAAA